MVEIQCKREDDKTWGEPAPFVESPFDDRPPGFSPDGRWLAYVTDESGRRLLEEAAAAGFGDANHSAIIKAF